MARSRPMPATPARSSRVRSAAGAPATRSSVAPTPEKTGPASDSGAIGESRRSSTHRRRPTPIPFPRTGSGTWRSTRSTATMSSSPRGTASGHRKISASSIAARLLAGPSAITGWKKRCRCPWPAHPRGLTCSARSGISTGFAMTIWTCRRVQGGSRRTSGLTPASILPDKGRTRSCAGPGARGVLAGRRRHLDEVRRPSRRRRWRGTIAVCADGAALVWPRQLPHLLLV